MDINLFGFTVLLLSVRTEVDKNSKSKVIGSEKRALIVRVGDFLFSI